MTITFTPSTGVKQEQSSNTQFEVNIIGCMTDCNFYIPDSTGDTTGLAFRTAYHFAKNSENNKEICTCVGSMLCSVVLGFKNSIEEALKAIGVRPCFVSLPSQAHENNIVASEISQLEWPSILLIFGYFLIVLLKPHNDSDSFDEYRTMIFLTIFKSCRLKLGMSQATYLIYHLILQKHMQLTQCLVLLIFVKLLKNS
jgi:hypothetical protein